MANLNQHLDITHNAIGLAHQQHLKALRGYLKSAPVEDVISEIKGIRNPDYLRTLWEAGLTKPLQDALLQRLSELT